MSKSLKTLIKISKNEVDRLQKELAELIKLQDFHKENIETFKQQIAHEKKIASDNYENHEISLAFVYFVDATNKKIDTAQEEVDRLEELITAKRDVLREAFSEQKKFEIVDANNKERAIREFKYKEGIKLDDIGINGFIRNEKDE